MRLVSEFECQLTPELEMYDDEYYAEAEPLPLLSKQNILDSISGFYPSKYQEVV